VGLPDEAPDTLEQEIRTLPGVRSADRFAMPPFMQALGVISPHDRALTAYQDILLRGYSSAEILPECAVLLAMAVVMFGIAAWKPMRE
jgi:ABC-type multidrug transport system permease subunit